MQAAARRGLRGLFETRACSDVGRTSRTARVTIRQRHRAAAPDLTPEGRRAGQVGEHMSDPSDQERRFAEPFPLVADGYNRSITTPTTTTYEQSVKLVVDDLVEARERIRTLERQVAMGRQMDETQRKLIERLTLDVNQLQVENDELRQMLHDGRSNTGARARIQGE
jgi:hypothetical protein